MTVHLEVTPIANYRKHTQEYQTLTMMIPAWVDGKLQPVEKLYAHTAGLRHKAVSVFVMCNDKILLQRRALCKYHTPGLWANTCCTHPHWQEDPAICATRRLTEELGINGLILVHRGVIEYRTDVGNDMIEHEVVDLFTAQATYDLQMAINLDEASEASWVSITDLHLQIATDPAQFTPWLRIYLAEHAARIFDATD